MYQGFMLKTYFFCRKSFHLRFCAWNYSIKWTHFLAWLYLQWITVSNYGLNLFIISLINNFITGCALVFLSPDFGGVFRDLIILAQLFIMFLFIILFIIYNVKSVFILYKTIILPKLSVLYYMYIIVLVYGLQATELCQIHMLLKRTNLK